MKVNKIHVKNFRVISDTTLDTGGSKFVVIRGKNGQGKTSLAEALSLGLIETTWGLDKRGAGFAKKIKRGEQKSVIETDLQGANRLIRRTTTLSVTSTGRTQKSEDLNDPDWHPKKFDDLLSDKKTALNIAINTRAFMSMVYSRDEDAQKSLLAQLVLPARYDFPKDTISDVEKMLGEGVINFNGEPFAVIEQAYKKLPKEREDSNRKVKDFSIPDALPIPQGVDSISLQTKLADLRGERVKQSVERDAASKKANEAAVAQARTKARIETLEATIRVNKEALRKYEADILSDPSAVQELANKKPERDRLLAGQQRLSAEQEAAKKQQTRLNEISQNVGSACPTCDQEIDEAKITQLAQELVAERQRLTQEYVNTTQALAALGGVDEAIVKLAKHKQAVAEKGDIAAKIEEQEKELKAAIAEAGPDAGGLFESSTHDTALAETDRKIEAILQQIHPVAAAEERAKEIVTKKEQLKRLEEKAAKLDTLVKYFDKDGIKAKLIATYIGSFEQKVNSVLSVWDYSCSLSIEPFKFYVTNYRKDTMPLIELSGAEELMFYAAFQCAVSATAGIGFVVIDRVDTLLPELRPALYRKLYQMTSENVLDQIILLVADTSEQVPALPNSAFFNISEGNIRRLG